MREQGVAPNAFTYSTAIRCCIAEGQPQLGLDLLEEITSDDRLNLSWQNYAGFIHCCVESGEEDVAVRLFEKMKQAGLLANNPQAYEGVIRGCLWACGPCLYSAAGSTTDTGPAAPGPPPLALVFFSDMLEDTGGTTSAYDMIIGACRHGGKALELLEQMQCQGLAPSESTYSHAIRACNGSGDTSSADKLRNEAESQGMMPGSSQFAASLSEILS
jgi:pentatricopeptide repeat protein